MALDLIGDPSDIVEHRFIELAFGAVRLVEFVSKDIEHLVLQAVFPFHPGPFRLGLEPLQLLFAEFAAALVVAVIAVIERIENIRHFRMGGKIMLSGFIAVADRIRRAALLLSRQLQRRIAAF